MSRFAPAWTPLAPTETEIHLATAKLLAIYQQQGKLLFWHIPNGGKRGKIEAAILRGMGVKPGMPDIEMLLLCRSGRWETAFIEIKDHDGKLSDEQKDFRDWCGLHGIRWALLRDPAELPGILRGFDAA